MRWCPQCGWPKEFHKKVRIPIASGTYIERQCILIETGSREDFIPSYRADAEEYRRRWAADIELRRG